MSDLFGLLPLPAVAPAEGEAVTDPALDMVLAFCKAAVNSDLGVAWAAVCPGDPLPITYVFNHNPDLESFNGNETPALYMWRSDSPGSARFSQDYLSDEGGFTALWVPPSAPQEDRRLREPFRNGLHKCLRAALALARHPAWIIEGDDYYTPEDYGSVLLHHAKLSKIKLGQFRAHELIIESEDKSFRQPYDCLLFSVDTVEMHVVDATAATAGHSDLDHLEGTTTLPDREDGVPVP